MTSDRIDRDLLASSMSWLLAGTALIVLDVRFEAVDVLWDPAGALVVALGVERVRRATPTTGIGQLLRAVAWLHVALLLVVEIGVLTGEVAVGGGGLADASEAAAPWRVLATSATTTTGIGVVLLARHLRTVLTGVASDRWRQVTIAWVATLVALPLLLLTGALELVLLGLAVTAIAGVLLLVALFATRRAAEEDILDRDFDER